MLDRDLMMFVQQQENGGGGGRERADSVEQFFAAQRGDQGIWGERSGSRSDKEQSQRGGGRRRERDECREAEMDTGRGTPAENKNPEGEVGNSRSQQCVLMPLPSLVDAAPNPSAQRSLLLQKLRQCQHPINFASCSSSQHDKEVKGDALRELCEFVAVGGQHVAGMLASEEVQSEMFRTVETNLFRALPPNKSSRRDDDPEELFLNGGLSALGSAALDTAWPHIQLVYRLLRSLTEHMDIEQLQRHVDGPFVGHLLQLFHADDPREREQAKLALYAIYARLVERRAEIRKRMGHALLAHTFEGMPFNGADELLQILGDIVNGFNVPLKEEHRHFFLRVLLPLHKSPSFFALFAKLAYCVALFIEKDPTLASPTVAAMLKYWPRKCSAKEVLFLTELEEVFVRISATEFRVVVEPLFRQLAKCATSQHFKVAEKALLLWNNSHVLALLQPNCERSLPIIFPALYRASQGHWNDTISALVFKTLKTLMKMDGGLFDELVMNYESEMQKRRKRRTEREELWRRLSSALEERRQMDAENSGDEDQQQYASTRQLAVL